MPTTIDYRHLWKLAYRAARMSAPTSRAKGWNVASEARAQAHLTCRDIVPYGSLDEPMTFTWHVDRMARCAAGETVMSKGIADRVDTAECAAQARRYAVSIGRCGRATFSASLTASGGREYLAIARRLIEGNARDRSTFVAPLP